MMTKPDTYAKKSQAEKYLVRAGHERAFIFVDEDTGTLAIVSSFGNWGYTWTAYGAPERTLKEFLAGLEFDYFFGKVDDHNKGREFDAEKTVENAKRVIIEWRRGGGDRGIARDAWDDLILVQDETDGGRQDVFMTRMYESSDLYQVFDGDFSAAQRRHPQCEGFWTKIWPVFLEAIKPAPAAYLIRKRGAWYRPNSQGYTTTISHAGRYSLEEAIAITHPNGPDGPRDGMSYQLAPEAISSCDCQTNPNSIGCSAFGCKVQ